jgi:hypothetical protein
MNIAYEEVGKWWIKIGKAEMKLPLFIDMIPHESPKIKLLIPVSGITSKGIGHKVNISILFQQTIENSI